MSDRVALTLLACALTVVVALLAGVGAGYLARRDNATYPAALGRAALAFVAFLTLAATIASALSDVAAS
ncbi:hypothetical protein GCM10022233_42390 [Streptomyces shaanxiensis]|uniref:Uncharacterized protein n=2 Tax=Streptomyces shaanxiensis TaxID=653357 RepID=A0ABP7VDZ1_9ACTN